MSKKSAQKSLLLLLIAIIIVLSGVLQYAPKMKGYFERREIEKANEQTIEVINEIKNETANEVPIERETPIPLEVEPPEKAYLEVQFICQAPLQTEANWVSHEESCEEAALLQTFNYESGTTVTKEEANDIILEMIAWQEENFGGHHDVYADKLKEFAIGFYGLKPEQIKITYDASIEDIKEQINLGHPVIVPITGEILKNPYYPYPGYHMLVVTGYTEDRIITNDNGTKRGEDFSYDTKTFKAAMKDAGGDILIIDL